MSKDFNQADQARRGRSYLTRPVEKYSEADFALESDVMKPLETSERIEICTYLSILIIFGMGMMLINQTMF